MARAAPSTQALPLPADVRLTNAAASARCSSSSWANGVPNVA